MKASLHAVRIAPKKANLMAKMIRGMPVPDAMEALRCMNKKSARLFEQLLRSAIANASHNDKQDAQMMIVRSLVVNKAEGYRRGTPMARGRIRPMRKWLSHIDLVLGFAEEEEKMKKTTRSKKSKKMKTNDEKVQQSGAEPSQKAKTTVEKPSQTSSS